MVHKEVEVEPDRCLIPGRADLERCDNKVVSARYTAWNFLPIAISEQFRRFANLYFLIIGGIMAVGYYTTLYESAISPWTTLGPLSVVISISLSVEGTADLKRHKNDSETNNATCVIIQRSDKIEADGAKRDPTVVRGRDVTVNLSKSYQSKVKSVRDDANSVNVGFQQVRRMDIRQGHFVLVKNREMIPADIVILASSNDQGGAYIETSSIDGETNLKLRQSPNLPKDVVRGLREPALSSIREEPGDNVDLIKIESIEQAVKRVTRFSALGRPDGTSSTQHPSYLQGGGGGGGGAGDPYVAALITEPPNASVHTFSGKLCLPPLTEADICHEIPLGAENILLRGAVLRNTEWAIGVACFTGAETKLVQNSHKTPSKFSQLDRLMNWTVVAILCIMFLCIVYLSTQAVYKTNKYFELIWYAGFNKNTKEVWPYLPLLDPPEWEPYARNWIQYFFLYITLLNNFVPLSLYVTVEFVTVCSLWFIYADLDMYDDTSDTRAVARATIVTDLGRIQYIFSDKTGTLTQNVMRFKRCSVDGMIFGAPTMKKRPGQSNKTDQEQEDEVGTPFHPIRQLLVGRLRRPGLEGLGVTSAEGAMDPTNKLTFNAEMFLRVMSLCHTVVVEKSLDGKDIGDSTSNASSLPSSSSPKKSWFGRNRNSASVSGSVESTRSSKAGSSSKESGGKNADGAPRGYEYQAESPDEGALVSASSISFNFQVISRDSSGITVQVNYPSHLRDQRVIQGLKSASLPLARIAAESASERDQSTSAPAQDMNAQLYEPQQEKWAILAVNKFDSDRKRMSILLRSPPELGSLPILFCKGADSAMLEPGICNGIQVRENSTTTPVMIPGPRPGLSTVSEHQNDVDDEGWEMAQLLGMQSHLGEFAKEGLRTLVLGMRVLTERECDAWMNEYTSAATSMQNREELMTKAAKKIEQNLHIVGATAIEDKLQRGVPYTISQLGKAGIKLWVLTGDKRETAIEIGYSTHVLTPKMHLTEVPDNNESHIRTQMAMEFIRLIKLGRLPDYQRAVLTGTGPIKWKQRLADQGSKLSKVFRRFNRAMLVCLASLYRILCLSGRAQRVQELVDEKVEAESKMLEAKERRKKARDRAYKVVEDWLCSPEGRAQSRGRQKTADPEDADDADLSLAEDDAPPEVFGRATSAQMMLDGMTESGALFQPQLRKMSIAHLTVTQTEVKGDNLVDEDALSMESFFPGSGNITDYDKRKRTLLERMFAIDKDLRKGKVQKHMTPEKIQALANPVPPSERSITADKAAYRDGPRALVIEGMALKHLLGDPELEEILFAVASNCAAVIACRVTPKQKALLVNLVRRNIIPEPVTLAIGDGANDVGMIQEAHVGVGISGKEGKQAVNASDFAIAQFRFLEELILIHGRWGFFRLSTVVLFSFYKNAIMAGMLITYAKQTLYSGTPLFDQWIIATLNFVAGAPIIMLGLFDRVMGKAYVMRNPEVFKATRMNELITFRTCLRWIALCFAHIYTLYYFSVPQLSYGGGLSSAFQGLMRNKNPSVPGNAEGADLKSVGTVTFSCLVIMLAYKVLYEGRSLIHGVWPAFTCSKTRGEGFVSRLAYTWIGVTWLSIGFFFLVVIAYQFVGHFGPSAFSDFTDVINHVFGTRSLSWVLLAFIPIIAMLFDVCGKCFSNMFYPTQTQIHIEIESKEKETARRRKLSRLAARRQTMREPV